MSAPETPRYRYTGTRRDGTAVTGAFTTADLAAWVEAKYKIAGWRSLTVTADNVQVAQICLNAVAKRSWWSE